MSSKKFIIAMIVFLVVMIVGTFVITKIIISSDLSGSEESSDVDTSVESEEEIKKKIEEENQKYNNALGEDVKKMVNALAAFQTNNRGAIPKDWNIYYDVYLDSNVLEKYEFAICDIKTGSCPDSKNLNWYQHKKIVYVAKHARCNNNNLVYSANAKAVAFISTKMSDSTLPAGNVCANN